MFERLVKQLLALGTEALKKGERGVGGAIGVRFSPAPNLDIRLPLVTPLEQEGSPLVVG